MLAVCFYVEGRSPCGREISSEKWLSVVRAFGVDRMLLIDRTGRECFVPAEDPEHPVQCFANIREVLAAYSDARHVFVERDAPSTPTSLAQYEHPAGDAVYFFGSDVRGLAELPAGLEGDWIFIDTETSRWGLWAVLAASIVMSDRWSRGDR